MTRGLLNHNDTVVSVLLASPFDKWDEWQAIEQARFDLVLDPHALVESLEEVRLLFSESLLAKMNRIGAEMIHDVMEGDFLTGRGFDLCVERWEKLPYFTCECQDAPNPELVTDLFYRYPWFLYLMFTDPAL